MRKVILLAAVFSLIWFSGCTSPSSESQPTSSTVYKIGDKVTLGDFTYTLNEIYIGDILGGEYAYEQTEGEYNLFELTIVNNSNKTKTLTPSNDFIVIDEQNRTFKPDMGLSVYAKMSGFEVFSVAEQMQPSISKTAVIVFELPKNTKGKLKISPGLFSGEAFIEFE